MTKVGRIKSTQKCSDLTLRIESHTSVESDSYSRRHIKSQTSEKNTPKHFNISNKENAFCAWWQNPKFFEERGFFFMCDLWLPQFLRNICYRWPINCGKLCELSHLLKMGCDLVSKSHSVAKAAHSACCYHLQGRSRFWQGQWLVQGGRLCCSNVTNWFKLPQCIRICHYHNIT
jgi:hypothetical protein